MFNLKNQENHVQLKEYQSFHMVLWFFHVMKMKLSHVLQLRCSAGEASDLRLSPFPPKRIRTNHWHTFVYRVEITYFCTPITAKDQEMKTLRQNSAILRRAALSGNGQSSIAREGRVGLEEAGGGL
jgi:hypothetical protein